MYLLSTIYFENAENYSPFTILQYQFEYNKAKELCEETIKKFPKSDGAVKAQNMLNQILEPLLFTSIGRGKYSRATIQVIGKI